MKESMSRLFLQRFRHHCGNEMFLCVVSNQAALVREDGTKECELNWTGRHKFLAEAIRPHCITVTSDGSFICTCGDVISVADAIGPHNRALLNRTRLWFPETL